MHSQVTDLHFVDGDMCAMTTLIQDQLLLHVTIWIGPWFLTVAVLQSKVSGINYIMWASAVISGTFRKDYVAEESNAKRIDDAIMTRIHVAGI